LSDRNERQGKQAKKIMYVQFHVQMAQDITHRYKAGRLGIGSGN